MRRTDKAEGLDVNIRRIVWTIVFLVVACLPAVHGWAQDPGEPPAVEAVPMEPAAPEEMAVPPEQAPIPEEMPAPEEPVMEPEPPPMPTPARPMPVRPRMVTPARPPSRRASMPGRPNGNGTSSVPSGPSDDPLPKNGGTPNEPAEFNFNDAALTDVVTAIGRMTGKNFDVDPSIAQTRVTLITHDEIPPDLAYEVLESILSSRGFSMVETLDGHLVKIVPTGQSLEKVKMSVGTEGIPKAFDTLSTHVVSVQYGDAGELATFLPNLGSAAATVTAYQRTNTLIITDTADGLRRILQFLKEVDIPGFDTEMEIFTLEYSRAEVLSQQIQDVLLDTGGTGARPGMPQPVSAVRTRTTSTTPTRLPIRPTVPGQSSSMVVGNREETLRIVSDERLNALIVVASSGMMERVRDLVAKLDTPTPYEANNMNVYKLLNADAEKVEEALNAILGTTPRQASDKGGGQAGEIQPFEKKVVVTRYEQTNALLVLASPQDYKLIKEIIAQLDVPQRQVLVEAVIMDVSLQDTFGLSVDAAGLTGNDGFAMGNTSNLNTLFSATSLAENLSNGTYPVSLAKALIGLGSTGGLTAGVYDSFDVTIDGTKIEVPFVPFLVRALQTLTDIDILSQPSLTTQDNEPADIVVGQEIPIPQQRSGYSYASPGTDTSKQQYPNYGMTSYGRGISREDVGVKMKVTPHINEGDYISLETEIEVSETTPSDVGIDANELGPTLNKSRVTNNVVVKDGTTGVIGGLIKETTSHKGNQIPGLSDVPLLGWLFRTQNDTRKKQNVVVLVTPYIIKDGVDLDRVTNYKMNEFQNANVDVLWQKGVIERVRKRHEMRSKYRPSVEHAEKLLEKQGQQFGRGDIKR